MELTDHTLTNLYSIFVILFIISFLLTYVIRIIAHKYNVLDFPNDRSSHVIPTPRGGGLAIVLTWYIGISILFFLKLMEWHLYFALMSGLLLAVISVIDDLIKLKPIIRLSIQGVTAVLALIFLKGLNPVEFLSFEISSKYILYPIVVIGIVWFINLFNFLDGIDGYASLESIMIAFVIFLITRDIICLILIISVIGFLFWNWPKAKIFMGDIGSTQLGFILIILGIYFHNQSELSILQWMMLSSLFWFDATLTLFRRWRNKENVTVAHRKHAYQRAVQSGLTHQQTLLLSILVNMIIIGLTLLTEISKSLILPLFLIDVVFLYVITRFIDKKIPFK